MAKKWKAYPWPDRAEEKPTTANINTLTQTTTTTTTIVAATTAIISSTTVITSSPVALVTTTTASSSIPTTVTVVSASVPLPPYLTGGELGIPSTAHRKESLADVETITHNVAPNADDDEEIIDVVGDNALSGSAINSNNSNSNSNNNNNNNHNNSNNNSIINSIKNNNNSNLSEEATCSEVTTVIIKSSDLKGTLDGNVTTTTVPTATCWGPSSPTAGATAPSPPPHSPEAATRGTTNLYNGKNFKKIPNPFFWVKKIVNF